MKIVVVTACPSGVAHTYMAAEALEKEAKKQGIGIKVETQGSIGVENRLTTEDIAEADAVILTKDMRILDEDRFAGKKIARINISDAIRKTEGILKKVDEYVNK